MAAASAVATSDQRDQWLRIAMQDVDREFIEYDIRGDIYSAVPSHVNFEYRVRGRSLAEAIMAFFDLLNEQPTGLYQDNNDTNIYDYVVFELPEDDLAAKRWMRQFVAMNPPRGYIEFTLVQLQLLDEIKDKEVLVVRDMPGTTGRDTKPAREP